MSPATHVSLAATAASAAAGDGELPRQAKTRKGKRALQERGPQEHEDVKRLLLLRGSRANASVQEILADLRDMKKPNVVYLRSVRRRREGTQQQAFHPFEDVSSGEFLCEKNSCGFFCLGSTSKKRPARLVFARMFAHQLLDMYELQVFRYTPASAFRGKEKPHVGSTPIVLLQGAHFEADEVLKGLRNFFADLFRGSAQAGDSRGAAASSSASKQQRLYLAGIDRVIAVTALEPSAHEAATAAGSAQAAAAAALQAAVQSAVKKDTTRAAAGAAAGEEALGKGLGAEDGTSGELRAANGGQLTKDEQQQKAGGKAVICLRQYRVVMKKALAGSREPRVELEEVGPQIDMQLDRYRLADADRWKKATACRAAATAAQRKQREAATAAAQRNPAAYRGAAVAVPAAAAQKNKKKRKTTTTALGDVVGRVYVDKPDWRSLNAQKNVLLIKHNRKRAKLAAEAAAAAPTAESPTAAPAKGKTVEKGGAA